MSTLDEVDEIFERLSAWKGIATPPQVDLLSKVEALLREGLCHKEMWEKLGAQLELTKSTGFREKTTYALIMMETIEQEANILKV